jgi:hypothetical protein
MQDKQNTEQQTGREQDAEKRPLVTTATRLPVAIVAALLLLLATAASASAAQWQYFNTDADRYWDAAALDQSGNGYFEDLYFDLDNDAAWDTNLYNTRGSESLLEVADYDMDENNEVELRLQDGDQRVGFDYLFVDLDQNGAWDRFGGRARRIVPGSNIDAVTRTVRYNASQNLIHSFYMRTGMSLLYPSFPACC